MGKLETKSMKLNIGCGWRNFGSDWTHIDYGDYDHLDYKCNVSKKLPLSDNIADLIYASHVIAYFDKSEIEKILLDWKRVLKPGGIIRLATPDFESMSKLYENGEYDLCSFLGPMYGKMDMDGITIYHKTVYDLKTIYDLLDSLGFNSIERYNWRNTEHSSFDDHSQAYIPHMDKDNGTLISLNVQAIK